MSRRWRLDSGESLVISVTPVARGVVGPFLSFVLIEGGVTALATQWGLLHRYEGIALLFVGFIPALLLFTRTWRWRSHKITVTTRRVLIEGGVLSRYSTQVNVSDVVATRVEQSLAQRLRRRGAVVVDTSSGSITLPIVRHPAALGRLIDRTRRDEASADSRSWDQWFADPDPGRDRPLEG